MALIRSAVPYAVLVLNLEPLAAVHSTKGDMCLSCTKGDKLFLYHRFWRSICYEDQLPLFDL